MRFWWVGGNEFRIAACRLVLVLRWVRRRVVWWMDRSWQCNVGKKEGLHVIPRSKPDD